jgi:signal transduction histidine kinase
MRRLLTDQLDLVAAEARATLWARVGISVVVILLMGLNLGPTIAVICFAGLMAGEAWTWRATAAPAAGRPNTLRQRLNYVGTMVAVTSIWASMAAFYWWSGEAALRLVAVCILASQLIHAQAFAFRSKLALALLAGPPALLLVGMPILFGGFTGIQLATVAVMVSLSVIYVANSAILNMKAAQALEDAQQEAVAANEAKSAFLAMMSHELRTPMNGVLGMAHVLRLSDLNERQADQVEMLIRSGDGLMTILNDILDISKIEAGKLELETTAFDLTDVCARVCDLWTEVARAKGLSLTCEIAPGAPRWVTGDPTRIRQILLNLVSNALKFTDHGEVRLSLARRDGARQGHERFEIVVADSGLGMTPDQQVRLFQSFSQADASTARRFGGTGLGLAICKQLSALMGGQIAVESAPGQGSTFRVALELPRAEPLAVVQASDAGGGLSGLRILVAEDNPINQAVVRAILEAMGAEIEAANDGGEALEMLIARPFDLVLMDIHMPRMDGIAALRAIRAGEAGTPAVPVIALTADAMAGEDQRLLALGFDGVQPKPIRPAALVEAIAQAGAERRWAAA